jgi:hypothetical protein
VEIKNILQTGLKDIFSKKIKKIKKINLPRWKNEKKSSKNNLRKNVKRHFYP